MDSCRTGDLFGKQENSVSEAERELGGFQLKTSVPGSRDMLAADCLQLGADQTSGFARTPGPASVRRLIKHLDKQPEWEAGDVTAEPEQSGLSQQDDNNHHHMNLALGIGIQNFPEGLAVSLPLRGAGFSTWRAFWYGQLSGMVEPLAGVFGAFAVVLAEPILPYALAFAAGAMVYVIMDDIIPEAQISGNGKLASWASILGFVVMMSLDVGLG
ncbi:hypothetical protein K5549_013784 [Capra hircus]|nr:hypothetical protein K5549_013784 [Capra hircus]